MRSPVKIRITKRQLRECVRSYVIINGRLDEGFLDDLKDFVSGFGADLSSAFQGAAAEYEDPSGIEHPAGTSAEELKPEENPYDQVYILSEVMWHIGTAVEFAIESAESANDAVDRLEPPTDEILNDVFMAEFTGMAEEIARGAGTFREYLTKSKSNKIEEIGLQIESGDQASDTLKSMAEAITNLEGADPMGDWDNIIESEAVKNALEGDDEKASKLQSLINETKGVSIEQVKKIGQLKTLLEELYEKVLTAQDLVDEIAVGAGAKPEESELLSHYDPKYDSLRVLIRESLMRRSP